MTSPAFQCASPSAPRQNGIVPEEWKAQALVAAAPKATTSLP